ncbi:putative disease resistance RPP13-like protein 1 [Carex rostrata]
MEFFFFQDSYAALSAMQRGLDKVVNLPTSSLVHEPNIYGRRQDKENLIALLLNRDGVKGGKKDGNLCVLPIVGMGGVGKTTLAQLVYNDPAVNLHFDMKAWVCVSKEFNVEVLTRVIISSFTKTPCIQLQLDYLQRTLKEKITGQRFLLVLDDVWNENTALWHLLRAPLYHSPLGKILVTARNEKVAKIMQTIPFYPLRCLDEEYSWELFKQVAFENQDPRENSNLLEIGRKITVKCQGLPLAIKAIGCALSFELEEKAWRDILESELWELDVGVNEV